MKKIIALSLILLAIGSMAFADDAKVMPGLVGRLYVAPNFSFASQGWDVDGEKTDKFDDPIKVFNLGFALEFGVIDWITAAIQWVPGWTVWSDITPAFAGPLALMGGAYKGTINTNGVADLFVGAKIQIIGSKAPVANDTFRLAIAPGVVIPLPGPDFKDVRDDVMANKDITGQTMDNHVFAAGGRLMFDWQLSDMFFINLFNESIFFIGSKDMDKDGPTLAITRGMLKGGGAPAALVDLIKGEVKYGYKLTFEIEPVFSTSIADGLILSAGLPVRYVYKPAPEYSYSGINPLIAAIVDPYLAKEGDPSHSLYINPNISFFLTKTFLPLEFKLQYNFPIWGQNSMATHTVALQIKAYFAFPGADL